MRDFRHDSRGAGDTVEIACYVFGGESTTENTLARWAPKAARLQSAKQLVARPPTTLAVKTRKRARQSTLRDERWPRRAATRLFCRSAAGVPHHSHHRSW